LRKAGRAKARYDRQNSHHDDYSSENLTPLQIPTLPTQVAIIESSGYQNVSEPMGLYFAFTMPGGFQVPSPGGRMEGGSVFGQ